MISLGIESTAHTIGIGIVEKKKNKFKILANESATYPDPGIHPRKAADFQSENFHEVLQSALTKAGMTLKDIDIVSFSQGPGLGPCLKISCVAARAISLKYKKPIVGVNHCVAHIEISKFFTKTKDPLVVYVSGGNTQIIIKEIIKEKTKFKNDEKKEKKGKKFYKVIGETLDISLGNLLDVFAREIGEKSAKDIERIAIGGKYIELPYTVKGIDLSYTGLLTHCIKEFKENKEKVRDICYSIQETAFSMLCEAAERALALTKKKELILCGGVAQNKRLQEMFKIMSKDWGFKFGVAPNEYNRDNGAMIAYTSLVHKKVISLKDAVPIPKYRTDKFIF